jgi:hypothetical protein
VWSVVGTSSLGRCVLAAKCVSRLQTVPLVLNRLPMSQHRQGQRLRAAKDGQIAQLIAYGRYTHCRRHHCWNPRSVRCFFLRQSRSPAAAMSSASSEREPGAPDVAAKAAVAPPTCATPQHRRKRRWTTNDSACCSAAVSGQHAVAVAQCQHCD